MLIAGETMCMQQGGSIWQIFYLLPNFAVNLNCSKKLFIKKGVRGFPRGAVAENLPANAGDTVSSSGLGRSYMPRSN